MGGVAELWYKMEVSTELDLVLCVSATDDSALTS
jgi:hypothetical protein